MSAVKRTKDMKERANHSPCPCGESSDAYTEYEDGHGFCYSCNKPFNLKQVKPSQLKRTIVDGYRGISKEACEFVGIYSYVDEDGNVLFREYEAPEGKKFRRCPKDGMWQEGKYPALAGTWLWNAGSAHYITVLEGEEDAGAFYDMMMKGKKTKYPFVWLTSASIPKKEREAIHKYLSQFQTVKLAIDNDEAGGNAKRLLREMLPNKIREVPLTKHKDANDYLINGDGDEFKKSWENAPIYTPENVYNSKEDFEKILNNDEVESYIETPFEGLNEKIKGIPLNYVTLITGEEGIGKTEVLRALEYEVLRSGTPIAVLHQEETKKKFLKLLAGYELLQNCNDPDNPVDTKEILSAIKKATDNYKNLYYFEFMEDPDVPTILEQFKYLVHVCGVRYIFIDPINQFDPVDDSTRVEFLDRLAKASAKFVTNNPVGLVWTAHVNDEGKVRDSRMIAKAAGIRIDAYRDVMNEDPNERNCVHFSIAKNRPFSDTGDGGVAYWNNEVKIMEDAEVYESVFDDDIPFKAKEQEGEDDDEPNIVPID